MKPYNKKAVLESLEPFFRLGYSRYKACKLTGFDEGLLNKWEKADSTISIKIDAWIAETNIKAREVWKEEIKQGSYQASKEWLERREKEEFSLKQEVVQESTSTNTNVNIDVPVNEEESRSIIDAYLKQQGGAEISGE
jgi:transcriptional regulator with XRE-family HTH domain